MRVQLNRSGVTFIEVIVAGGILGVLLLLIATMATYMSKQTQSVYQKNIRQHTVMSYVDMIRSNLSYYQAGSAPCEGWDGCIADCPMPSSVPTVHWSNDGICEGPTADACLGTMQVMIRPLGENGSGQRGFFSINLCVSHPAIAHNVPAQYQYLVNSQ